MDWNTCSVQGVATLACLPVLFIKVLNALFIFSGVIAVIIVMFSGYKYIFSAGDSKQIETAQKTFYYALIGLFIILISTLVLNVIATVTGVKCILQFGPGSCS